MTRKRLEALLFGIIGALIVQISIAATSQYLMPINSPSWLNTALGVKQSVSVNVTATTITQASTPNNYVANPSNSFDFSGPFLSNGNGLQIGNAIPGYYSGILVNEPSNMSNPLLLLGFNNSLMFTVSANGNVTAAGNINGGSIGSSTTPITGSTLTLSATNITALTVPYSSLNTHSIQIGTNSMSVAYPSAALFISVPTSVGNTYIPLAISNKNGSSLFTVDTIGNISAAGNISGSSIGFSKTPITGSTLTLSATNITALILPFPTASYTHGIRMGGYITDNTAGIAISAPSQSFWPFVYFLPTSDINGAMHIGTDGSIYSAGNVSAVNGTFSGNVNAVSYGTSGGTSTFNGDIKATSGNISTKNGTFSGVVNLSGGTLNKIAYGRFSSDGTLQPGSSNISNNATVYATGVYIVYFSSSDPHYYPVCVVSKEGIGYASVSTYLDYMEYVTTFDSSGNYVNSGFDIICFWN